MTVAAGWVQSSASASPLCWWCRSPGSFLDSGSPQPRGAGPAPGWANTNPRPCTGNGDALVRRLPVSLISRSTGDVNPPIIRPWWLRAKPPGRADPQKQVAEVQTAAPINHAKHPLPSWWWSAHLVEVRWVRRRPGIDPRTRQGFRCRSPTCHHRLSAPEHPNGKPKTAGSNARPWPPPASAAARPARPGLAAPTRTEAVPRQQPRVPSPNHRLLVEVEADPGP